jgi:hypothetical protein
MEAIMNAPLLERYRDRFIDAELGFIYLRVPTWCPFRLQFYCNGHSRLARQLAAAGIGHAMADNAFIAYKIGLTCHGTSYSNTANGKVQICTALIDTLQIGGITLTNVEASVMPDMTDVVLLGQSALRRLKVEQANDQIRLSVMLGVRPDVIEKCLNHVEQNKVVRIYQRQKLEAEQAKAWRLLGERLELLLRKDTENVVVPDFVKAA